MECIIDNYQKENPMSLNDIKGVLLQHVNKFSNSKDALTHKGIDIAKKQADTFINEVIQPLMEQDSFDPNKITWYYAIYKEAKNAKKIKELDFFGDPFYKNSIHRLIEELNGKSIEDLLTYGTSYLATAYSLISSYNRDMLAVARLDTLYKGDDPLQWIKNAETNQDILQYNIDSDENTKELLHHLSLILNLRL